MEFKILGSGCCNCDNLEKIAKTAVKELGIDANVIKITDIGDIARHGILSTPELIDNGRSNTRVSRCRAWTK